VTATQAGAAVSGAVEHRIDDLARLAGTTVRNVRAYQDRGLLAPPRKDGRVGWYSDAHLARLRLISQLLERGFSLANIGELVGAFERGTGLSELLGLAAAVASPFSDEVPGETTPEELAELFGVDLDIDVALRAAQLGLVESGPDGHLVVPSPRLLQAGAELARSGVPLPVLLDQLATLRSDVDAMAERFVQMVVDHVIAPSFEIADPQRATELAAAVWRIRPLAEMVVDSVLASALERHAHARLGEGLSALITQPATP
jgi:DNA-binding transcriptional MerR regulator